MSVKKRREATGANGVFSVNGKAAKAKPKRHTVKRPEGGPEHVALVALGPSSLMYNRQCEMVGGRRHFCDETWTVNTYGDVILHDMLWHMDDVRTQEIRAAGGNIKIGKMLEWIKTHEKKVMTSRAYPEYPSLVAYPLEDVVNALGIPYFNNTTSYAIAYAIYSGVKQLTLYGFDFTYPNAHHAEKGRACCEYWAGQAMARGVKVSAPDCSTFMDANLPFADRFYGYDTQDVDLKMIDGRAKFSFTDKAQLPTAAEIEDKYDHTKHPTMPDQPATPTLVVPRSQEPFVVPEMRK